MMDVIQGDITRQTVDVIVNAANSSLMGGGGVDGAIHRAGGRAILEACKAIVAQQGGCKTGQAVLTTAGLLPAQRVVHTVGPIWFKYADKAQAMHLLSNCYRNSLEICLANGYHSIAFPNISTGVYGFPKELACEVALKTVQDWLVEHPNSIKKIVFVCFDEENYLLYKERGIFGHPS